MVNLLRREVVSLDRPALVGLNRPGVVNLIGTCTLRRLTRQQDPSVYVRMLLRAQEFSSTITGDDMNVMEKHLQASNAFKEHDKAKLKIMHE